MGQDSLRLRGEVICKSPAVVSQLGRKVRCRTMLDNPGTVRILVVEDDKNVRGAFQRALLRVGLMVDVAGQSTEALEKLNQSTYDVVVSDVKMPGMDGIGLLKKIKAEREDTIVIMITGHGTIKTAVEAMKLGARDFITKPIVEIDSLRLTIERRIENFRLKRRLVGVEEVNRMKDEFLAIVSHELRTPLTPVQASTALLLEEVLGSLNDEQKEVLQISEKKINGLLSMIKNLLLMAELQKSTSDPKTEIVPVSELVQEAIDELIMEIEEKEINIENLLDGDQSCIPGDRDQLRQVFVNILDNAVKFNKTGGKIRISMSQRDRNVCYAVNDTGVGIATEDLDKIFNRFQQVEDPMTRKFGGLGLGLAISKKIVEGHGGEIAVDSEIDEGTTLRISLPCVNDSICHSTS